MATIDSLSGVPRYSIKAVCRQTGITAVTLRAWERRYNLLTPHRTTSNYRLYSEREVALLRWLKARVDGGMAISNVAAELAELRTHGRWPEAPAPAAPIARAGRPAQYAERLFKSLVAVNEAEAGASLSEAHSLFDLSVVCLEVMAPCLERIGDGWRKGELLISTEHLASTYLCGRLLALLHSFPWRPEAPRILMACAPGERHEIGGLMLAALLRREGFRVDYLGTSIPADDLAAFIRAEKPALACFSACSEIAARELQGLFKGLGRGQTTRLGYGGRAFVEKPALCSATPGIFLGDDIREARSRVVKMLG